MSKNLRRVGHIDVARGIAIILMVFGHGIPVDIRRSMIFSFHMPIFIIISGMFFDDSRTLKEVIVNILKKLVLPIFVTYFVYYIITYSRGNPINIFVIIKQLLLAQYYLHTFFPDIPSIDFLYFLALLASLRILFYFVIKIFNKDIINSGLFCLFLSFLGLYLNKCGIHLPWSLDIAFTTIIFFWFGYLCRNDKELQKLDLKKISILLLIYIVGLQFGSMEMAICVYPNYLCFINSICGSLLVLKICYYINKYYSCISKILQWYGKNSIIILCTHLLEKRLIDYSLLGIDNGYIVCSIEVIVITIMVFSICKITNFISRKIIKENIYVS